MFGYFWIPLGLISILIQCASGVTADNCESNAFQFWAQGFTKMPEICTEFTWRFNHPEYRINFTESEVETLCSSDICKTYFRLIILPCTLHVRECIKSVATCGCIAIQLCIYLYGSSCLMSAIPACPVWLCQASMCGHQHSSVSR